MGFFKFGRKKRQQNNTPPTFPTSEHPVQFGFFGAGAGAVDEYRNQVTYTFAPGWGDPPGQPLTMPTVLFSPDGGSLKPVLDVIKEQGGLHHIIALYPQDEPDVNHMSDEQTIAVFERARADAASVGINVPIMVIYGVEGTPGISHADIVGRDRYGAGPQFLDGLRTDQKRIYVPGGADPWKEDPMPFVDVARRDPQGWGVVSFIWLDQWGGSSNLGVRSNGMREAHRLAYEKAISPGF